MASSNQPNASAKATPSPPPPPSPTRSGSSNSGKQDRYSLGSGNPSALPEQTQQPSSNRVLRSTPGAGAFYGMLRKTKHKTYSALRGGRKQNSNHLLGQNHNHAGVSGGNILEYSSSDSNSNGTDNAQNFDGSNNRGAQAARVRSPFAPSSRLGGFLFSPQNSWAHDAGSGGGGGHQNPHGAASGVKNVASFGNLFQQQQQPLQQQEQQSANNDDAMSAIVHAVECNLRQVVLCCVAFIAGAAMPERASVAWRALELSSVAWGTCLLIVFLGWLQGFSRPKWATVQPNNDAEMVSAADTLPSTPMTSNLTKKTPLLRPPTMGELDSLSTNNKNRQEILKFNPDETKDGSVAPTERGFTRKRSHDALLALEAAVEDDTPPSTKFMRGTEQSIAMPKQRKRRQNVHPQLDNLYVMVVGKRQRIFPNAATYDIDNDLFSGKMLFMFRTPEVDEPASSSNDPVVNYLRGKQRRFEFQWQFRLKKLPAGDVFMGAELEEPIHMGMIQRALSNGVLKFVKKMNQGFTSFLSDSLKSGPSYLSFPVGTSMDRFHAADIGEGSLPVLGQEIPEDAESMKLRKRGAKIEWDTGKVYTMALWSAYFDWLDWQILNFPGIRPFSATSVAGVQPIRMTLFTDEGGNGATGEKKPKRNIVFAMEVSNAAKATLGSEAKKWIEEEEAAVISKNESHHDKGLEAIVEPLELELSDAESNGNETFDEEDEEDMDEQSETVYDDTCDIEDLEEDDEGIEVDEMALDSIETGLEEDDEGIEVDEMALDSIETGCYLLSGSSISLREGTGNYVSSGGGYAVLQSSPTSSLVLEKVQSKKKKGAAGRSPSMMIRSGDVVRVKLVEPSSKTVKYLSLHRGWWLRWSSTRPKRNNGLFYIRTSGEPNGSLVVLGGPFSLVSRRWSHYLIGACLESSAKYGGRMLGIYKTGKSTADYDVVVGNGAGEEDDVGPTMQANQKRMMPLLLCAENFGSRGPPSLTNYSTEDCSSPARSPTRAKKVSRQISVEDVDAISAIGTAETELRRHGIDVPAWLEVMDRTKRTKQLVYAVRVKETVVSQNNEPFHDDSEKEAGSSDVDKNHSSVSCSRVFLKLRTGRDLAPILRLGVEYKRELSPSDQWQQRFDFSNQDGLNDDADSSSSSSDDSDSEEELDDEQSHFLIAGPNHSEENETFTSDQENDHVKVSPDDQYQDAEVQSPTQQELSPCSDVELEDIVTTDIDKSNSKGKGNFNKKRLSVKMKREKSLELDNSEESFRPENSTSTVGSKYSGITRKNSLTSAAPPSDTSGQDDLAASNEAKKKIRVKHAAVIGRVAKTVKASTVVTGKHVIKHSKNIGKGTVSAGRAAGRVIPVSSVVYNYKPPRKHEPGGRVSRKRSDKGQMKMIGKAIKNIEGQGNFSTSFLAGQLLAPDQSCRKVSRILSDISNTPKISAPVLDAISSLATTNSAQDLAFLRGSSAELGVLVREPVASFDIDCVVARCIYSGRWREELCVMYTKGSHLAFYAPLAKKPSLVVSFDEIISARKCEDNESRQSPLPGFHLLSIDTAWKCHYLAFLDKTARENFQKRLNDALFYTNKQPQQSNKVAQEYESYRMSLETSLTGTVGKWRTVSVNKNKQKKQRRILNGRRMAFDLASIINEKELAVKSNTQDKVASYVENLLTMALSFSPEALDATDARFIEFLGETSRLRTLPLHEIDLSSKEAFCIFVNLYHCLLQHSLLLAVDGLPNKRSVIHFKRCSCYEIGEDVFSLAELECCVIRSKTSRTTHIKPPFVSAAKKSRAYRMMYGLGSTDHRVNFILNNGDLAYPSTVPVLQSQIMDDQMDAAASCFLTDQVRIDKRKRTVFLPKVCDVYGTGDGLDCLSQCLVYLDEDDQLAVASLLDGGVVSVKFKRNCDEFHPSLTQLC